MLDDEGHYLEAPNELKRGEVREGLWFKSPARCDGDEARARSVYVGLEPVS